MSTKFDTSAVDLRQTPQRVKHFVDVAAVHHPDLLWRSMIFARLTRRAGDEPSQTLGQIEDPKRPLACLNFLTVSDRNYTTRNFVNVMIIPPGRPGYNSGGYTGRHRGSRVDRHNAVVDGASNDLANFPMRVCETVKLTGYCTSRPLYLIVSKS